MSEGLGDFFKLIVEDKKKKKEEFDNLVGEINLDSLFSEIKGSIEENKKNSKKVQKQVNAFESWLKSETEEEKEEIVIEVADDFKEEVDTTDWRDDYVSTEIETEDLIKPEPLKPTPSVIDQSIKILDEITEEVDPLNDTKFATFDDLKKHYQLFLDRISVQLSSLGGGGIEDAPKTGGPYARRNQAWEVISLSGGGGGGGGINGITLREEGSVVGTSNSVQDINFVSDNLTASASGIGATITLSDTPTFTSTVIGSGVTINDDGINVTGVVTATSFDGSLSSSDLDNSSVNYGGVTLALGGSDATPAFDLSDATAYPTSSLVGTITNSQLAGSIADGKLASTFLKNVVEDTTPQLGGNLDLNSKFITGTGGINVSGIVTATNIISVKSDDGTSGRLDLYCESNNAHYARLQAPDHGDFSGNPTIKLPAATGTLLLSDGSGANLTSLNASNLGSGTVPDDRFPATLPVVSGANLTNLTGASADTYGDGSNVAAITVDANGRITGISEVAISGGSASDSFKTISVSGQSDVVADSATDTLTLIAGNNMTITTDASGDSITLASSGGGGGVTTGKAIAMAMVFG